MPRSIRLIFAAGLMIGVLFAPRPALAQRPVGEYEVASRYTTSAISIQMTGPVDDGRDLLFAWGRMFPRGERGTWVPAFDLAAGITPGTNSLLERILAGPRVSLAYAFPSQFVSLGKRTRGEPFLIAAGGVYGITRFEGDGTGFGGAPFVAAGAGMRLFGDPWDVDLTTLEVTVEQRFGFDHEGPEVHLRFGRAVTPRPKAAPPRGPLPPPDTASSR